MLKLFLFFISPVLIINSAKCQGTDTSVIYYKLDLQGSHQVSSIDFADYYRLILPPDSGDNLKNVREYYKNGKVKLAGKFDPALNPGIPIGPIILSGDCVCCYPNGKKQSMVQFNKKGQKDGNEYLFYPNGTIYCYKKNTSSNEPYLLQTKKWECYDSDTKMICSDGNGQWIEYDKDFKHILNSGPVKNGYKEGEWHCRVFGDIDSINYTCSFHKDTPGPGVGYDHNGVAYPFTRQFEKTDYKGGVIDFMNQFKRHLTLPKDVNGKRMVLNNAQISFVVEKDGRTTEFESLVNVNAELNKTLSEALSKCGNWTPSRYYGVPVRTLIRELP